MADQPKEKGKGMASEEGGVSPNLEERLEKLNLQGEEEDDLDFSGEIEALVKEVRWLTLFRVHTSKPFSPPAPLEFLPILEFYPAYMHGH